MSGFRYLLAVLFCVGPCWSVDAVESIDIASVPVFLLTGAAPNLILTIDSSRSMNMGYLPEGIWPVVGESTPPQLDERDTSSLVNRQYYDPAQTYLPPMNADGTTKSHADFTAASAEAFITAGAASGCTRKLDINYAPTWDVNPSHQHGDGSDNSCYDLAANHSPRDYYAVDKGHPDYQTFEDAKKQADPTISNVAIGQAWAASCMGQPGGFSNVNSKGKGKSNSDSVHCNGHGYDDNLKACNIDCPAFYYRLNQASTACTGLDLNNTTPGLFPRTCLQRVVVGSTDDTATIYDRTNANVTNAVLAKRDALLGTDVVTTDATLRAAILAKRNFANWFTYYRTRLLTLQTVLSRVLVDLPERARFTYQNLSATSDSSSTQLSERFDRYSSNKSDFFLWLFQERATTDDTWLVSGAIRAYHLCETAQVYLDDPKSPESAATNPLRGCRNNFHVMFTDGAWTDALAAEIVAQPTWLANNDGTAVAFPTDSASVTAMLGAGQSYSPSQTYTRIFADSNTAMLADVVFASWVTDLRPSSEAEPPAQHRVPTLIRDRTGLTQADIFWNPVNDPADWQHITTFTISLGVSGNVLYPASGVYTDGIYNDGSGRTLKINGFPGTWFGAGLDADGNYKVDSMPVAYKIDDIWHAGINGRGGYVNASDPATLTSAFATVMAAVSTAQQDSSAAAVAVDVGSTSADNLIYQARLSGLDWSGDVRSFRISAGPGKAPCANLQVPAGKLCDDPLLMQYYQSAAATMAREARNNTNRRIFTAADGTGVAFGSASEQWAALTPIQRRDFLLGAGYEGINFAASGTANDPTDAQIANAKKVLDYVAGARSLEPVGSVPQFRKRSTLLGDFISAGPVLVGPPAFFYNATDYADFKVENAKRTKLLYAGANDGMLHAFDATTLSESFAFIPPALMGLADDPRYDKAPLSRPGLHNLSSPAYSHRNYVDGPIVAGDVRFGSGESGVWHTVLAGGLGLGAQALYALDVTTTPAANDTASTIASKMYLWQFGDRGPTSTSTPTSEKGDHWDRDLGYVMGQPQIARIRGSFFGGTDDDPPVWVLITGNGYNSAEADGSRARGCDDASRDLPNTSEVITSIGGKNTYELCGQAVLYVINIETGAGKKIQTNVGRKDDPLAGGVPANQRPNALGQPLVVATAVYTDGDIVADFAYAADLFGNVYRFDLTGTGTTPVRTLFAATDPDGTSQPITSGLEVVRHPTGQGTLVLFGTGKYLSPDDREDPQVQSFYAIWDTGLDNQPTVLRANLAQQHLIEPEASMSVVGDTRVRQGTADAIDWTRKAGWYVDFDLEKNGTLNRGERVVTNPKVLTGWVAFTSLVPEIDPCIGSGYSWLNILDVRTGGAVNGVASIRYLTVTGGDTGVYSSPSIGPNGILLSTSGDAQGTPANVLQKDIPRDSGWRVWQQLR